MAAKVLIVDDCARFRAVASELLTDRGLEVFGLAAGGDQAIELVAGACPDGILLDVNLPGPDGFTVAAVLAVACPSARIVLTSADADHVSDELVRTSGAIAFVAKDQLASSDLQTLLSPVDR